MAHGQGSATATHEAYLHAVRDAVIGRIARQLPRYEVEALERLGHVKLVYGIGDGSYRGVCHYGAWSNGHGAVELVEVAATAEESWVQLAGTTIHELGHVLAGIGAGHGPDWKRAAECLGLRAPRAAGQRYALAALAPEIRFEAARLAETIGDGSPAFRTSGLGSGRGAVRAPRPCSAGIGTRGGTSRGAGSGSRSLKVSCPECGYVARVTRRWLDVGAPVCPVDTIPMVEV